MTREEALEHVEIYGRYIEHCDPPYTVTFEGRNIARNEPRQLVDAIMELAKPKRGRDGRH
jgi:hypothetical protein